MPTVSEAPSSLASAQRTGILIIDDDPTVRASLNLIIKPRYKTFEASHREEALAIFIRERPALITLDLCLPQVDGLQILQDIRQHDPDVPVIIITGHASLQSAQSAMRLGAHDYLEKPFDVQSLLETIDRHISKNRPLSRSIPHPAPPMALLPAPARDPFMVWDVLHDIRNPLTVIQLQCEHMESILSRVDLLPTEKISLLKESLQISRQQSDYCREMLNHSNNLGRIISSPPVRLSLTQVLQEVRGDILHLARDKCIILNTRFPSSPIWMSGNPRELRRMLNNICINALQAVPAQNGLVHLEAWTGEKSVTISIRDNGPGIPEAIVSSIFRPFFTTKGKNGSGLGLHIARFIAHSHQGEITVHCPPGGGCRFDIQLPVED